jgi:hypothetical protein
VVHLESIDYRILRGGPWQLWLSAYDSNVWCRGVNAIYNRHFGQLLAAPLNSLPGRKGIELARYDVADVGAWAGFPHVHLAVDGESFHTQRIVESIAVEDSDRSVRLRLVETLQAEDRTTGGRTETVYTFDGEALRIDVTASGPSGRLAAEFHVRKHPLSHLALWFGDDARALRDGKLPVGGGHWGAQTFSAPKCPDLVCVQVDNTAVEFELLELPTNCVVDVDEPVQAGLHAGNFGGTRLRIADDLKDELRLSLRVTCRAPAMASGG